MLEKICEETKNWFCDDSSKHIGTFTISNGIINLDFVSVNQYFRIVGSVFNDGVYQYLGDGIACRYLEDGTTDTTLTDETFTGAIWAMKVPISVIAICTQIRTWVTNNNDIVRSPYTSESFGGYSYSKRESASGQSYSWQEAFKKELNAWRKIR